MLTLLADILGRVATITGNLKGLWSKRGNSEPSREQRVAQASGDARNRSSAVTEATMRAYRNRGGLTEEEYIRKEMSKALGKGFYFREATGILEMHREWKAVARDGAEMWYNYAGELTFSKPLEQRLSSARDRQAIWTIKERL